MAFELVKKRGNEEYGVGLVRSTSFGRKRVALSSNICLEFVGDGDCDGCNPTVFSKRQCFRGSFFCADKFAKLADLPPEILIRVICGVEHDDLKSLFFVSKAMREATLVAKQTHFAYSTPRKTLMFQNFEHFDNLNEIEAPNAPKQSRVPRSRLSAKKLADISVNLFGFDNEVCWPKKDLFMETETGI